MARGLAGRREGTGWGRGGRWSSAVGKARPSSRGVPLVRTLPASGPSQRVSRALLCQRGVPGRWVPRSGLRVPPIAGVVSQRRGAGAGAAMGGPRWRLVKGSPTLGQGKRPRLRVPLAGTRRQAWLPAFLALGPVGASVSKPRLEKDSSAGRGVRALLSPRGSELRLATAPASVLWAQHAVSPPALPHRLTSASCHLGLRREGLPGHAVP